MSQRKATRILLLDEDPKFAARLKRRLEHHGVELDWRSSLLELGSVGGLGAYDLVLVEPTLGPVTGLEVAEYAETFFPKLPVLFLGRENRPHGIWLWPKPVVGFVSKDADVAETVLTVVRHGTLPAALSQPARRTQPLRYATA